MKTVDEIHLTLDDMNWFVSKIDPHAFRPKFIALDEFKVCLSGKGMLPDTYRFKWDWIENKLTCFLLEDKGKGHIGCKFEDTFDCSVEPPQVHSEGWGDPRLIDFYKEPDGNCEHRAELIMMIFYTINLYLCSIDAPERVLIKTPHTVTETTSVRKKNGKKKKPKVYIRNEYRLIREYASVKMHRPHSFSCPAWGVRGHYRHYKDGKVIFIKPYVKGKKKNEYRGKEYVLAEAKEGA